MTEKLFLITHSRPKTAEEFGGLYLTNDVKERDWWDECRRRKIPCVIVHKSGNSWACTWDCEPVEGGPSALRGKAFLQELESIIRRSWTMRKEPIISTASSVPRLDYDEAVELAEALAELLNRDTAKA
jgi:hypothetical protein